jgi:hypothetical protein
VVDELVVDGLLGVSRTSFQLRYAVDHIVHQMEAIQIIHDTNVERRGGGVLFLVAPHMQIFVIRSAIGESVNEPWVSVKREDNRLVFREQGVEMRLGMPTFERRYLSNTRQRKTGCLFELCNNALAS